MVVAVAAAAAAVARQLLRDLLHIIGTAGAGVQSVGTQGRIKCVVVVGRDASQLCQAGGRRFVAVGVGMVCRRLAATAAVLAALLLTISAKRGVSEELDADGPL